VASEWVGVVGTGIGAGIGGVVTVVSLWIKGRQDTTARREAAERDDRLRADDRKWQLIQQHADKRREVYGELLGTVNNVVNGLAEVYTSALEDAEPPEDNWDTYVRSMAPELVAAELEKFRAAAKQITLVAVDAALLRGLTAFELAANAALVTANTDAGQLKRDAERLVKLRVQLQKRCRLDLGFDTDGTGADGG